MNVNATVQRVAPENLRQRLLPSLTEVPRIAGRPTRAGASACTVSATCSYRSAWSRRTPTDVARNGRGRLVVQRAIRATQHCEFTPAEAGAAWDDLVSWVRPASARPATP